MVSLEINTLRKVEFLDITSRIEKLVREKNVKQGVCIIFSPHTTAGLTINENADPSVREDIINHLEALVPKNKSYAHLEGNADAHIKASVIGNSLSLIIEDGNIVLGTWQGIYFCEFDGPRKRKVLVKIVSEKTGK